MKNEKLWLFNGKKGINDVSIISIILTVFFLSAITIPYLNDEYGVSGSEYNTEEVASVRDDYENINLLSPVNVLKTVGKLAIWDFGDTLSLPVWLDLVYTIFAILLVVIIFRNIWPGGGG